MSIERAAREALRYLAVQGIDVPDALDMDEWREDVVAGLSEALKKSQSTPTKSGVTKSAPTVRELDEKPHGNHNSVRPRRTCGECGKEKATNAFYTGESICIICSKSREKPEKTSSLKQCAMCGVEKLPSAFRANSDSCKECLSHLKTAQSRPPEPSAATDEYGNRICANGKHCRSYEQLGEPSRLSESNKNTVCFACERSEREAS